MIVWRLDRHYSLSYFTFFSGTGCGNTVLPETFRKRSSKFGYTNKTEMHSGSYGTTT